MRLVAAPLLLALLLPSSLQDVRETLGTEPFLQAQRVALDAGAPQRTRVGALTYLGGVRLTGKDPAFGGFSAMHVAEDRFTLLSDRGGVVGFRMGRDWVPRDVGFGDLPTGPGTGNYNWERDSEALAVDPATGAAWVAFESENMIWRYPAGLAHPGRGIAPAAMAGWPEGGGPESMVRLRDGRFVVISESERPQGRRDARVVLRYPGDPLAPKAVPETLGYVPPAGYSPTEVAELPDGRLLVLNRRFAVPALFTAKLTLLDLRRAPAGAVVRGMELATLERPLLHDNFEAMALTRENAETILWIASDDNGMFWQRTLLLKFRLDLPAAPRAP